jgi:hypothetical protein
MTLEKDIVNKTNDKLHEQRRLCLANDGMRDVAHPSSVASEQQFLQEHASLLTAGIKYKKCSDKYAWTCDGCEKHKDKVYGKQRKQNEVKQREKRRKRE